jgi:hypothetical protein
MDGSKTQQSILPKAVGLKARVFGSRALYLPRTAWHLARLGWHVLRDLSGYRWEVLYYEFLRWLQDDVGIAKRRAYFTPQFGRCGAGLILCQGVLIQAIERACVGDHFGVSPLVMIDAAGGGNRATLANTSVQNHRTFRLQVTS